MENGGEIILWLTQWLTVLFLSMFKFLGGIIVAINSNLGFFPGIMANLIGGAIGIYVFAKFDVYIKHKYILWKYGPNHTSKIFNKRNRRLVKFRERFGLWGIAITAPIILSPPVGVMLALTMTDNKRKVCLMIYAFCIFWSVLIFVLDHFFHLDIFKMLGF